MLLGSLVVGLGLAGSGADHDGVTGADRGASATASVPAQTGNRVITTIPLVSSPIAGTFDPANGDLYFPDSTFGFEAGDNSSNLTIVSGATDSIVATSFLGAYANPQTPTYAPSSHEMYVADQNGSTGIDNVSAYSPTNALVANIPTGYESSPTTAVYDPANQELYVADLTTEAYLEYPFENVSVVGTLSNTLVTQVPVGGEPVTGVYDPADGDLYVPNFDSANGTNVSVIDGATNTVVATIGGLSAPITPAYDPINQEVYVPDGGGDNITVLKGTESVASIPVGDANTADLLAPPTVDPANGDVFEILWGTDQVLVIGPSNAVVATIGPGVNSFANLAMTYDPINGEMYVPGYSFYGGSGGILAINATSDAVVAVIDVGGSPQTPTFDPDNDDLYVPNLDTNNISVIGGGPVAGGSPPPSGGAAPGPGAPFLGLPGVEGYWVIAGLVGVVFVVVALVVRFRPRRPVPGPGPAGGGPPLPTPPGNAPAPAPVPPPPP